MVIGSDKTTAGSLVLLTIGTTALLLLPAIWNGFPLTFPDSGVYLMVAWGKVWTVDRSGFYGLFLKPLSMFPGMFQIWIWLALQAAVVATIILKVTRQTVPSIPAWRVIVIIILLVFLTSLPWHAAQLMPDAFAGMCVLAVWLACRQNPTEPGTPMMWLVAYLAGLMHYTHVVLIVATVAGTLLVQYMLRQTSAKRLIKRGAVCAAVSFLIIVTQITANGLLLRQWTPAPVGYGFLFARLHEDGLVQPWLARHCPEGQTPRLCLVEPRLPRDSQQLLWRNNAAFLFGAYQSERPGISDSLGSELRTASLGSITEAPLLFARNAVKEGAAQFVTFRVLDDECPTICRSKSSAMYSWTEKLRPALLQPYLNSPQVRGTIRKDILRGITTPISAVALLLMPVFGYLGWRRRDSTSCSLVAAVGVALAANALVTGAFSDVHDRYQSRVVWLAPFTLMVLLMRWRIPESVERNPAKLSTKAGVMAQTAAAPRMPNRPSAK